jgi:outer membrane protein assembly factor BamB
MLMPMRSLSIRSRATISAAFALTLMLVPAAADRAEAQSWLQWGGPTRDFHLAANGLHWKGDAPRRAWSRDLGDGYSAVIGDAKRLYVAFRRGDSLIASALDAATGKPQWERVLEGGPAPKMFLDYGSGPNATPALVGNRLFLPTFNGVFHALDTSTGKTLWTRELWRELHGTFRDVGYSSSPLVIRDLVILPVGGSGKAMVAFRQSDGTTAWTSGDLGNAMSSPILVDVDGESQIISLMVEGAAGFDPATGAQRWFHPHKTDYDVNATTPVWDAKSKTLIVSSAYGAGTRAIRLRREGGKTIATEAWYNRRLRVHHGNMLVIGDHVYGSSGDFGPAPLTALEIATGKVAWQDRTFPKVNMIHLGDRTILLDEDGRLAFANLTPAGLRVLQQAPITTKLSWTVPTLIGTRLYVRDRKTLIALDLEQTASSNI